VNSSRESGNPKQGATRTAAAAASTLAVGRVSRAQPASELREIINELPAGDAETGYRVCQRLLAGGSATIAGLVGMVGDEFGDSGGIQAKYALHGLVSYASRPGAEKDRKLVAETLAGELMADHSRELKAFLVRQLQWCGGPGEVPALAALLTDERLCEPATQALLAIGGDRVRASIRGSLPAVKGKLRATVIKALGRLRDRQSAAAIRGAVTASDPEVRTVAMWALANMGDRGSVAVLLRATDTTPSYERDEATDAALLLGRRLALAGNAKDAEKVFRYLLNARRRPEDAHHRSAALRGLAEALGVKAVGDVLRALDSEELWYRAAAARAALDLASSIQTADPAAARKVLSKILRATQEKAVIQKAELLLGKAGR
jgi:hypothetical protein